MGGQQLIRPVTTGACSSCEVEAHSQDEEVPLQVELAVAVVPAVAVVGGSADWSA
jgi:acyl-CoA synthetase (NDP forming)